MKLIQNCIVRTTFRINLVNLESIQNRCRNGPKFDQIDVALRINISLKLIKIHMDLEYVYVVEMKLIQLPQHKIKTNLYKKK